MTKSDKYAIEFLHKNNKNIEQIAQELELSIKQVQNIISKLDKQPNPNTEIVAETKKNHTKDLIIRQTSAKKNSGVAIMTQGAAQLSDDFLKNAPINQQNNSDQYIYRRPQ
jgi:translation initiation factor IF-2